MTKLEIDMNEVENISQKLKALTSLLYALADAECSGFVVDGESLNHLGGLSAECRDRLNNLFTTNM